MSQIIPIYIPTYINNADYTPARVLPRLLFYNGVIDCQTYWIESGSLAFGGVTYQQNSFPYFDNYNVVSGSFPTTNSDSLLFNNEAASYGEVPINSLYTTYWEKYIQFLYNPKTRILNCSAIIPLADYFHMELNDIVNFRGNYWHLRAINDYSLKTGECNLQLLGPVIPDVFDREPPAQASSSVSWSYTESSQDGTFTIYDNATTLATLTANGSGNTQVSESHYVTASLVPVSYPGPGVTMAINVNGGTTLQVTGSTNTTISASFLVGAGQTYKITGSISFVDTALKVYLDAGNPSSYAGSGTTWYDLTSNANNLTLTGAPTYDATTGSFYFPNNTGKYASNTSLSNTDIKTGSYSVEVWQRYTGPNDNNYYIPYEWGIGVNASPYISGGLSLAYGDNGLNDMLFQRVGGANLIQIIPSFGDSPAATYTKTTDSGNWRQVVVTRAISSGDVNMYVNGSLYKTIYGMYTGFQNQPTSLYIGSNNPSNPFGGHIPFYGDISIFKLWTDKVVSATEVSASFAANKSRFGY
jgi:hypothetical protein